MRTQISLLAIAFLLAVSACDEPFSARAEEEIVVTGRLTTCMHWFGATFPCIETVRHYGSDTTYFGETEIKGFTFEWGVRQHLLVERLTYAEERMDASNLEFRLVRVISRKRVFHVQIQP